MTIPPRLALPFQMCLCFLGRLLLCLLTCLEWTSSDSRGSQYMVIPLSCSCPTTSADNFDRQKWGTQWWNAATILQLTSEPSQWRTSQPNTPPVLKLETPPLYIQRGVQILILSFRPSVTRLWIQQLHFIPWPFHMSFFHLLSLKPETLGMCEFHEDRGDFFFHFIHSCVPRCLINNCWVSPWTERQRLPPRFTQTLSSACSVFSSC